MTNTQKQYIIHIISETNSTIENWAANWARHGRLKMASHPKTSTSHIISKTIREAHDGERVLKAECWRKVNTKYPGIPASFFDQIFHDLMQQIYFNLKSDLFCYRQ